MEEAVIAELTDDTRHAIVPAATQLTGRKRRRYLADARPSSQVSTSSAAEPAKARDPDPAPQTVLVPFGVLELNRGAVPIHQPWLLFGHSRETSDFF